MLTNDVELYLDFGGRRLDPVVRGTTVRIHLLAGAAEVWLDSRTARPCNVMETVH